LSVFGELTLPRPDDDVGREVVAEVEAVEVDAVAVARTVVARKGTKMNVKHTCIYKTQIEQFLFKRVLRKRDNIFFANELTSCACCCTCCRGLFLGRLFVSSWDTRSGR